jgi:hypothetical protein
MTDPTGTPVDRSTTTQLPNRESASSRARFALDHFDRFAAILHRFGPKPAHHLRAPVDIEVAIRLIQPPRADDETVRRDHSRAIGPFSHVAILPQNVWTVIGLARQAGEPCISIVRTRLDVWGPATCFPRAGLRKRQPADARVTEVVQRNRPPRHMFPRQRAGPPAATPEG